MVATLHALDDLARLPRTQVAGYARTQQDQSRRLYDDTRQVDPASAERLSPDGCAVGSGVLGVLGLLAVPARPGSLGVVVRNGPSS